MDARMGKLIVNRMGVAVLALFVMSLAVFVLADVLPGGPAQAGGSELAPLRYLNWVGGMLAGDFGRSPMSQAPIGDLLATRLPVSLALIAGAAILSIPLGLALGILSTMRPDSSMERALNLGATSVAVAPGFLVAVLLALVLGVTPGGVAAVPRPGEGMPAGGQTLSMLTLVVIVAAQMARMTRAALHDALGSAYAEMAMLKGVRHDRIVLTHALPGAIGSIGSAAAVASAYLLSGTVIVETLFDVPGAARLMVDAAARRDVAVVQACAMVFGAIYIVLVFLAELTAILSASRLRRR
jgi:peptide/nickel transport system permease protein